MSQLHTLVQKGTIWTIAKTVVKAATGIFVTVYLTRNLSVDDYGIYNLLLALMLYVSLFSSFGVLNIFQRYIPELHKNEDIFTLKKLVLGGLLLRTVLSATFVCLVIVFSDRTGELLQVDNWLGYFKLFSLGIIFCLEVEMLTVVLTSLFLHKYLAVVNMAYSLIRAGTIYFVLRTGWALPGVLLTEVVAWGAFALVLVYCYYSKFARLNTVKLKTAFPLKRFFRYGGYCFCNEMGVTILSASTDFFVLSIFLGPVAVGIYAFANRVIQLFSRYLPHVVLLDVIRPAFFTKYAQTGDPRDLERMFNLLIKLAACFLFPAVVGILALGDKMIIYVFGTKYLGALIPLWIVALFTAINVFMMPTGLVLQALEKVQIQLYSKVFAIYNLIADLIVVRPYGVTGIALVTGSAVLFKNLYCFFYARKYTGLAADWKGLCVILINSALMGLLLWPLRTIVTGISTLILAIFAGLAVYASVSYFNKAFSSEERNLINKILPKPIFVF